MLTEAQIEQYRTDGYVVVAGLLDSDTIDPLRAVTDEIVSGAAGIGAHTDALDLENSHRPDTPRVRRIKKPHLVHPFYRELAAHPGIMDALTPLIGENIRLRPAGKVNIKARATARPSSGTRTGPSTRTPIRTFWRLASCSTTWMPKTGRSCSCRVPTGDQSTTTTAEALSAVPSTCPPPVWMYPVPEKSTPPRVLSRFTTPGLCMVRR